MTANHALMPDPAATTLQHDAGLQRQKHESQGCPPGRSPRRGSGFAPARGRFECRGADPTILGTGLASTTFEAAEAFFSMAIICL